MLAEAGTHILADIAHHLQVSVEATAVDGWATTDCASFPFRACAACVQPAVFAHVLRPPTSQIVARVEAMAVSTLSACAIGRCVAASMSERDHLRGAGLVEACPHRASGG